MRLRTKEFVAWVDMEDGSKFRIRDLPAPKQRDLILVRNDKDGLGLAMDAYTYQFVGWEGQEDENGEELEFSKKALMDVIARDLETLNEAMKKFNEKLNTHKESLKKQRKNA